MAYCSNCGAYVMDDAVFCHNCGNQINYSISSTRKENVKKNGMEETNKVYTLLGIFSLLILVAAFFIDNVFLFLILCLLAFVIAIVSIIKKCKLKGFPIVTIVIGVCMICLLVHTVITPQNNNTRDSASNINVSNDYKNVTPELKEFLDSYESFIDEYIVFMKEYNNNPTDIGLLTDYYDFLSKYNEYLSKVDSYKTESMTTADYNYYIEVTTRCSKKILNSLDTD
ncbi:zinc-ribbon domain-containing protein [Pseudobutyrivibrio sp. OR37]|uniref:DUF6591 domain-containing protein n=1 Tax=Pseudobutyrivibrio sp. OR37 TaxID=1798186 RepID=UPI0008E31BB1|nr:DUF6591 domain-containing protein [Pseudobutyrivibrio sp. OR37]SFH52984.1 zinc-ribbon domain-containing protein [Pseudobutyrivibrio sp. OR37]